MNLILIGAEEFLRAMQLGEKFIDIRKCLPITMVTLSYRMLCVWRICFSTLRTFVVNGNRETRLQIMPFTKKHLQLYPHFDKSSGFSTRTFHTHTLDALDWTARKLSPMIAHGKQQTAESPELHGTDFPQEKSKKCTPNRLSVCQVNFLITGCFDSYDVTKIIIFNVLLSGFSVSFTHIKFAQIRTAVFENTRTKRANVSNLKI